MTKGVVVQLSSGNDYALRGQADLVYIDYKCLMFHQGHLVQYFKVVSKRRADEFAYNLMYIFLLFCSKFPAEVVVEQKQHWSELNQLKKSFAELTLKARS